MNRRGIFIACLFCFLASIGVNGTAQVPMNPTDGVYGSGDWKYQFVVLGRGTSDEKAVGKLSFKGKEVVGNRVEYGVPSGSSCGRATLVTSHGGDGTGSTQKRSMQSGSA